MEVAAEAPIDTGSDGDAAAQQATTKALSKFLSYDELKAHLAVNYAGLEASLLPKTTGSLLFAQKEAGVNQLVNCFQGIRHGYREQSREKAHIYYAPDVQSL